MALTASRALRPASISDYRFPVPASVAFYKNEVVGIERAGANAGKVIPMDLAAAVNPIRIGFAGDDLASTATDRTINVKSGGPEYWTQWFTNSTSTNAVAATDVGNECYFADAGTVTITRGRFKAGIVIAVDSTKGVLVLPVAFASAPAAQAPTAPTIAFAANAVAPAAIVNGAVYDVPTTAGASTITLPAAAADGTTASFAADGTKNGHTVQYVDETGTTNLTTALTASKRHLVIVTKNGGKWFATAYVGP
jgi:hypothetical protein